MFSKVKNLIAANPFAALATAAFLVCSIHILTITEYPPAWFDEIEILEIGRFSIFNVRPEWSIGLIPMQDGTLSVPYPFFHYLSGAILEALYRLTGGFICGRIFMLLSLPCCAFALLAYLREKGISPMVAFIVTGMFLVDPNATICAHWYRPDLWCMAMTFLALTLIMRSRTSPRSKLLLFASGALTAMSLFFWITSVLLVPFVLLEFCLVHRKSDGEGPTSNILPRFVALFIGGTVATAILLAPLFKYIPEIISQYLSISEVGTVTAVSDTPLSAALGRMYDFIKIACRSPFTWFAAAIGVFLSRRHLPHAVLFAIIVAFIIATRVYHLRMVYLMPYVYLFTAVSAERLIHSGNRLVTRLSKAYLVGALAFGFALAVVVMNFAAWPESNTLTLLAQKLKTALPAKTPKVCLVDFEHEFYYAGRQLGWRMYSTYDRTKILEEPYASILDTMDAVIVSSMLPPLTGKMEQTLQEHGFENKTYIDMPPSATGNFKPFLANIFYAHGYPSFTVWSRRPLK